MPCESPCVAKLSSFHSSPASILLFAVCLVSLNLTILAFFGSQLASPVSASERCTRNSSSSLFKSGLRVTEIWLLYVWQVISPWGVIRLYPKISF
ncbi:hypothetical protein O6P43_004695 [Quillaja saponaria]|uniref:Uncharacterized protein n=1 Tax=Quillaja saponaria TaxID=32244 RepID=A0AAD7Q4U1_QUISA|nr:hypothetical protein O6P43_004695 [Quillaja saponaria]